MTMKKNKNIKKYISSFKFAFDVINNVKVYVEIMDSYFSNVDNRIAHKYLYHTYLNFTQSIKDSAKERGVLDDLERVSD